MKDLDITGNTFENILSKVSDLTCTHSLSHFSHYEAPFVCYPFVGNVVFSNMCQTMSTFSV